MTNSVCRVCLLGNVKMWHIQNNEILEMYEKLSDSELNTADRPIHVCYICCLLLRRCCRFSEMARRSNQILTDMLSGQIQVTYNTITALSASAKQIINLSIAPMKIMDVNDNQVFNACNEADEKPAVIIIPESIKTEELFKEESMVPDDVLLSAPIQTIVENDCDIDIKDEPLEVKLENSKTKEFSIDNIGLNYFKDVDTTASELTKHTTKYENCENYYCHECNNIFVNKVKLAKHISQMHSEEKVNVSNMSCGKVSVQKRSVYKQHMKLISCDKSFFDLSHLKRHMRINTGERPYICDKSFARNGDIIRHMGIHTGEKPYTCKQSDKSFSLACNLKTHLRIHTEEKPYICTQCDKSFARNGDLITHMRIHTGEKPYTCKQCDKSFYDLSHLKRHMRIHTGVKPYICKQCDRSFARNGDLTRHMGIHTGEKPYTCKQCDKSFSLACNLKTHMRIHTGEKPYTCKQCDKSFSQISHLNSHMRIHTGEKPYICELCDKSFAQNRDLIRHMRIHTGE